MTLDTKIHKKNFRKDLRYIKTITDNDTLQASHKNFY